MDLTALHSIMHKNGFCYFEGNYSPRGDLCINFSTLVHCHGDFAEIVIGQENNYILMAIRYGEYPDSDEKFENHNATDAEVFDVINRAMKFKNEMKKE